MMKYISALQDEEMYAAVYVNRKGWGGGFHMLEVLHQFCLMENPSHPFIHFLHTPNFTNEILPF